MKSYNCPACGASAQTETPKQGLTCPSCGIGWMPVHTETRAIGIPEQKPPAWRFYVYGAIALVVVLGLTLAGFGVWGVAITLLAVIAGLLAAVLMRLKKT